MSKTEKSMHQVTEFAGVADHPPTEMKTLIVFILRCTIFGAIICQIASCDGSQTKRTAANPEGGAYRNQPAVLRRGLPGEPRTLDPALADDTYSFQVVRDLFEGLTAEDSTGRVVPGVAKSWTVDPSGRIYTFVLRDTARWSDGEPVLASEFLAGMQKSVDPRTASGSAALLGIIKNAADIIAGKKDPKELGVSQIDGSSIKVELERPAPFILEILAQPIAAPLHFQKAKLSQSAPNGTVTNGAYKMTNRVTGSYIDLSRNERYWDAAHVEIQNVRYVVAESEATELREYIAGDLDLTYTVPAPDLARVRNTLTSELQSAPLLGTMYLALDMSEPPFRGNQDLRQALSMGIDRDLIAQHVTLGVSPAYAFVSNGITGYNPPEYEWSHWPREQQIAYARKLLQNAGYSNDRPLTITLYSNTGEGNERIMAAIAGEWKQNLGIETKLVSDEFRVFLSERKNRRKWDVARLGWWADYNDASSFLEIFATNGSQNDPDYHSRAFNESIDKSRTEPDPVLRIRELERAEKTLLGDYPIIPVYFYVARRLVKPYLGGAEITPLNRTYSRHLYWKLTS